MSEIWDGIAWDRVHDQNIFLEARKLERKFTKWKTLEQFRDFYPWVRVG